MRFFSSFCLWLQHAGDDDITLITCTLRNHEGGKVPRKGSQGGEEGGEGGSQGGEEGGEGGRMGRVSYRVSQ